MKRIYSRTGKVIIRLGQEEDIDREAFEFIKNFGCIDEGSDPRLKSIPEDSCT
jgi:hypothetical protein